MKQLTINGTSKTCDDCNSVKHKASIWLQVEYAVIAIFIQGTVRYSGHLGDAQHNQEHGCLHCQFAATIDSECHSGLCTINPRTKAAESAGSSADSPQRSHD